MPLFLLFFGLLLIFIIGLGVLLGSMDIKNIQSEWDKRRCDPTIMFSAFLYKPSSDPRDSSAFASDNFSFCVRSLIDNVFKELLAPVLGVFTQQMGAANITGDVLNSVRNQIGNSFRSFGGVFNDFFETYKRGTMQLSRMTQVLKQGMLKISAAVISIVFMGMSLMTSLLNTYDFIVKVVIIIMSIIVAMIVLLFFALIPFMPIIFTTIAILTAAGLGGAVGGMAGAFCIDPNALVLLKNGDKVPLRSIKLGDMLGASCGKVEGILETNATGPLYYVEGVLMSGSHMVLNPTTNEYIFAADYPGSTPARESARPDKFIILNTSTRSIPLIGVYDKIVVAKDWEEIPEEDVEGLALWNTLTWNLLNGSKIQVPEQEINHTCQALISANTDVFEQGHGIIQIQNVKRGMYIMDVNGSFTEVLGVYKGLSDTRNGEFWISSGVRILNRNGIWVRNTGLSVNENMKEEEEEINQIGYHLITESGTFTILSGLEIYNIRDFTEVGYKNIDKTYDEVRNHLTQINKKI